MTVPDTINGGFELSGAVFQLLNVRALLRDRCISGVSWVPVVMFTAWGLWNLFYYPHLGQWLSFWGGVALVMVNVTWVVLLAWFSRRPLGAWRP